MENEISAFEAFRANRKVLVCDDDEEVRDFVKELLENDHYKVFIAKNGKEAVECATIQIPDLILLDIRMPELDGYEVCKALRSNLLTRFIPIIILSTKNSVPDVILGLTTGADDYLPKPFDPDELKARVASVITRSYRSLLTNPLTKLPGNILIEEAVVERINKKSSFGFAYLDIDNFKAYNDLYGFKKGDEIILLVASMVMKSMQAAKVSDFFIGHIGGDDFVFITEIPRVEAVANEVATAFDQAVPSLYNEDDRARGYVVTENRQGQVVQIPLMAVSIAIVTNEKRELNHYARVAEIAAEMKKYAKNLPGRKGSLVVKDKRKDQ